jgi:hypothetical protein
MATNPIDNLFAITNKRFTQNLQKLSKFPHLGASDEEGFRRIQICHTCQYFKIETALCDKCKCYVDIISDIAKFQCPDNKW